MELASGKKKGKKLTTTQKRYGQQTRSQSPRPNVLRNVLVAFMVGGLIGTIGQALTDFFSWAMNVPAEQAANPAVATMIFLGGLLTGIGVFDRMADFAGAGVTVPVTGFANSVVSSALEFKHEGMVLGIGGRMFTLAGTVILFGVVTAFIVGLISAII